MRFARDPTLGALRNHGYRGSRSHAYSGRDSPSSGLLFERSDRHRDDERGSARHLEDVGVEAVLGAMIEQKRRASQPSFAAIDLARDLAREPEAERTPTRSRSVLPQARASRLARASDASTLRPPAASAALSSLLIGRPCGTRTSGASTPTSHVPYMSHIAGVAAILSRHGFEEPVVAAGALHDVMEDCGVTYDDAQREVRAHRRRSRPSRQRGGQVALVGGAQAPLPRALLEKPWEAQAITLADKIDNFQSIIVCARACSAIPGRCSSAGATRSSVAFAICSCARVRCPRTRSSTSTR